MATYLPPCLTRLGWQAAKDYVEAALVTVLSLHASQPPGDVLVFLTGAEECETLAAALHDRAGRSPDGLALSAVPLYAALPSERQLEAFAETPGSLRKIVVATNLAETSITIPGLPACLRPLGALCVPVGPLSLGGPLFPCRSLWPRGALSLQGEPSVSLWVLVGLCVSCLPVCPLPPCVCLRVPQGPSVSRVSLCVRDTAWRTSTRAYTPLGRSVSLHVPACPGSFATKRAETAEKPAFHSNVHLSLPACFCVCMGVFM